MKKLSEIPECSRLLDEMFAELDKLLEPNISGFDINCAERKKIQDKYWTKLDKAYKKYVKEHPEEFEDKK